MPERPVALREAAEADADALLEVITAPGVREWWGDQSDREKLRADLLAADDEDTTTFVIEVAGEPVGWLQAWEENEPEYRHGGLDIMLAPDHQARGIGPEALRAAARWLIDERGHHRVTIDPALANGRAIRAYEKVGFRRVGVLRRYWRGPDGEWQDGLLMDLLADELDRA